MVNGDSKAASEATASLYESIKKEDGFNQKQELLQAAEKLNKAGNIEKQRAELNNVSVILWKLVENDKKLDQTVYYQYCPMKKLTG